jgi:hypothetical protein
LQQAATQARHGQSVLVFTPLALDAISSCGGTLARLAADGARIHYVVVYDSGAAIHRLQRACRILGLASGSVLHLGLHWCAAPEDVRTAIRRVVIRCGALRRPSLVLAPSWRSIDPCDAVVGRAIFEEMTEHTLLCYERTARANCGSRPVFLLLSPSQMRSKLLAIRPRRRRPGAKAPDLVGPAVEVLELARTAAEDAVPAFLRSEAA